MSDKTALIIGASRGLGLGLAQEFATRGFRVLASQRSPGELLQQAAQDSGGAIEIVTADVTDPASIAALKNIIGHGSLDLLVVNAGITGGDAQALAELASDDVTRVMMTNAVGPVQSALSLLPLVKDGGTVAMMSSALGSIARSSGGLNLYRISKTAQNMLSRSLFEDHAKEREIAVISLHPGWVRTDMGGANAHLSVAESVSGMADVLETERSPAHMFLDYAGEELPW